jgi:DnaJ-class molecular chaperone
MYENDRGEFVDPDTPCPRCGGDGRVRFLPSGELEECRDCHGTGDKTEFPKEDLPPCRPDGGRDGSGYMM